MAYRRAGAVNVGGVIPWLKSFANTPTLTDEYIECNGQAISDAQSVYNGQTIENINGSGGGTKRFLRGSTTSGTTGGSDTHTHIRGALDANFGIIPDATDPVIELTTLCCMTYSSHLPPYYEVVYICRIK